MKRRAMLKLGLGAAIFAACARRPAVADLEADGLSAIYRRHSLRIVGQRDNETAGVVAGEVVGVLDRFLPATRAQLARASDSRRVGVLIGTRQQDVAIMAVESADALFLARAPFDDLHDVPLRAIVSFGSHVLVCRTDFLARHAYLVAQTVTEHPAAFRTPARASEGIIPIHDGAKAFFAGGPMPAE